MNGVWSEFAEEEVEDPWDMVWTTAGFGLLGVTILRIK